MKKRMCWCLSIIDQLDHLSHCTAIYKLRETALDCASLYYSPMQDVLCFCPIGLSGYELQHFHLIFTLTLLTRTVYIHFGCTKPDRIYCQKQWVYESGQDILSETMGVRNRTGYIVRNKGCMLHTP